MSSILHKTSDGRLNFKCPGCNFVHQVSVNAPNGNGACWTFNGDMERPTFSPSVLVTGVEPPTDEDLAMFDRGEPVPERPLRCHSFVREGQIEFLADCTHTLAGKTVPLEAW